MSERRKQRVYGASEVERRLALELPHWRLAEGAITRTYRTAGWKATLMVVNAVGHLAEAAWHHPDVLATYASVEVRLSTHSAKGITDKDFALAHRIEELVTWRPGAEGGPLEGTPPDPRHAYIKYET